MCSSQRKIDSKFIQLSVFKRDEKIILRKAERLSLAAEMIRAAVAVWSQLPSPIVVLTMSNSWLTRISYIPTQHAMRKENLSLLLIATEGKLTAGDFAIFKLQTILISYHALAGKTMMTLQMRGEQHLELVAVWRLALNWRLAFLPSLVFQIHLPLRQTR